MAEEETRLRRLYLMAAVFAAAGMLAFTVDLQVLSAMRNDILPGDLRKAVNLAEVFGHGLGVVALLATFYVIDYTKKRGVLRLIACSLGSGIGADVIKILVGRTRPRNHEFQSIWDSFQGWCPAIRLGDLSLLADSEIQSFPSAHTATAVGLAIGLCYFYPRGRWLFTCFAILVAMQRMQVGAHFLSDTLGGAAIGCLIAGLCCDPKRWGRWFSNFESAEAETSG